MQSVFDASALDFGMVTNLGDGGDDGMGLHGEGANIAARIESLAQPGDICVTAIVGGYGPQPGGRHFR